MTVRIERLTDVSKVDIVPGFFAVTRSAELREMLLRILELDAVLFAALEGSLLVGYTADLPFLPIEFGGGSFERRWQRVPGARELGAIEVARNFRSGGIARDLLAAQVAGARLDGQILIGEGLCWHWDNESRGLAVSECRARLLALFANAGFGNYRTDEPEVSYSLSNFLVARVGPRVPAASVAAFEAALFERQA
jgi:acetoin utilization protein AcuA